MAKVLSFYYRFLKGDSPLSCSFSRFVYCIPKDLINGKQEHEAFVFKGQYNRGTMPFQKAHRALVRELENYPFLQDVEEATGIKKLNIILLIGPVFLLLRFFGYGGNAACNLVGYVYPAIASIRAIESKQSLDDTQWLTYWTVFAAFTLIEGVLLKRLLAAFPFYYAFKFGLLIWAQAPSSRGAVFVYSHLLAPFLKSHSIVPANAAS